MIQTQIEKRCGRCATEFSCRQGAGCWCEEVGLTLQDLAALRADVSGCVCPACLDDVRNNRQKV